MQAGQAIFNAVALISFDHCFEIFHLFVEIGSVYLDTLYRLAHFFQPTMTEFDEKRLASIRSNISTSPNATVCNGGKATLIRATMFNDSLTAVITFNLDEGPS
jgi:hypothetical protein